MKNYIATQVTPGPDLGFVYGDFINVTRVWILKIEITIYRKRRCK